MQVHQRPVADLYSDPSNARLHSRLNLDAIKASLLKFGQQHPLVVTEDGMVVAGNGRLAGMLELGWTECDTVTTTLSGVELAGFSIADNRTAELAEWDEEALARTLVALRDEDGIEVTDAGFDSDALADALKAGLQAEAAPVLEDEAPEPLAEAGTRLGDLWGCGEHRVLCGDCREQDSVTRLLDGQTINLAFTSPPYASQRKYDETSGFKPIPSEGYVEWFDAVQANVSKHLADDGSWFVNIKEHCEDRQRVLYCKELVVAHVRTWGWLFNDEFIWTHGGTPKAVFTKFKNQFEPIYHFCRVPEIKCRPKAVSYKSENVPMGGGGTVSRQQGTGKSGKDFSVAAGMAYPGNVLSVGKNRISTGHAAAFPVSLPSWFIEAFSDARDAIYDPFLGSGTTLISTEKLDRKGYGMEISPAYVDVIVRRWQNLTGESAVLLEGADGKPDGRTFDEVFAQRTGMNPVEPTTPQPTEA